MSDTSLEQTEPTPPIENQSSEQGGFGVMEVTETAAVSAPVLPTTVTPVPPAAFKQPNRTGTVEHLAARRSVTPLNAEEPEVKQRLSDLRAELTTLVTDLRWGGYSVQATVEQLIPMLSVPMRPANDAAGYAGASGSAQAGREEHVGSLQQWIPVLIPTILEIDRAGNLVPAWLKLVEEDDPGDLPADANPADTTIGRARRVAMLMLGYYKSPELSIVLSKLATDPSSSLYATQSLVKQGTVAALQALVSSLKDARGWAKVDVIDAFAALNQARFYEIMLASGLDNATGLESYVVAPLYRTLPLETYLRGGKTIVPRLSQQAALVFAQVLQDHTHSTNNTTLPVVFERDLPIMAAALFEGAKQSPDWRNALALHRLGLFLGRYWGDISRGSQQDPRITLPVYACLPMMPDIERWMNGPGRNALLEGLANEEEAFGPCLKVLKELRETRASAVLLARLDSVTAITDREHAVRLGQICDTLVQLGEYRVVGAMLQLVNRVIPVNARAARARRADNLPVSDPDIPASIVYAAAIRTCAQFNDRDALELVIHAARDFDPYVRTQALEALKSLDPLGEDPRSRTVVRESLNDPRDTVVRVACQLAAQYRDIESVPWLERLAETRPELGPSVQNALRQLR